MLKYHMLEVMRFMIELEIFSQKTKNFELLEKANEGIAIASCALEACFEREKRSAERSQGCSCVTTTILPRITPYVGCPFFGGYEKAW